MEKLEIIKEFCKYCNDLNYNCTMTKSKKAFTSDYMLQYAKIKGLQGFTETRKNIENTLKYNNLTINYIMQTLKVKN